MKNPISRIVRTYSDDTREMIWRLLITIMLYVFSPSVLKGSLDYELSRRVSRNAVRKVNFYKMVLPLNDKGISRGLFMYRKREFLPTNYLIKSDLLAVGDVVLDIGANIGYYAIMESKLVGETGKVYAVEPVSTNIKTLHRNIELNECKNIEVFHLAFGDKRRKASIHVSNHTNLCAIRKNPSITYKKVEEISMSTVDSFLKGKRTPNLVRMDVEGYENNILRGMTETLKTDVKLLIEIHGFLMTKKELAELFEVLKESGFKVSFVWTGGKSTNRLANYIRRKLEPFPKTFPHTIKLEKMRRIANEEGEEGRPIMALFSKSIPED